MGVLPGAWLDDNCTYAIAKVSSFPFSRWLVDIVMQCSISDDHDANLSVSLLAVGEKEPPRTTETIVMMPFDTDAAVMCAR